MRILIFYARAVYTHIIIDTTNEIREKGSKYRHEISKEIHLAFLLKKFKKSSYGCNYEDEKTEKRYPIKIVTPFFIYWTNQRI